MSFDLSEKIVTRHGQKLMYFVGEEQAQHDVLSLITEALWDAGGNDLKLTVKMGVLADRLGRSENRAEVDLAGDDVNTIKTAIAAVRYPPAFALPILKVIDPTILKE